MIIELEQRGDVWVLPDDLREYQLMVLNGAWHIGWQKTDGYFDAPLCGASTASRNVSRRREIIFPEHIIEQFEEAGEEPGVEVCDACAALLP